MPQCVGLSCRFSGRATIRGELALKRKHIIAAKAKKNQQLSEGRGVKGCQNSDNLIDTKKELSKLAGVSHDTISRIEKIAKKAPDDVKTKLRAGEMSINEAYTQLKRVEKSQKQEKIREQNAELVKQAKPLEFIIYAVAN